MIRTIAISLMTLVCLAATAQQKQLSKLDKWYSKGHYSTCYDRAKHFLLKYDAEAEMHMYAAISAMRVLRLQRGDNVDTTMLNDLLERTLSFHELDPEHKSLKGRKGDAKLLHKYILKYANDLYRTQPDRSVKVHVVLATVFKDTTNAYRAMLMPGTLVKVNTDSLAKKAPKKPQHISKPLPYADSLVAFASMFTGTPYKFTGCDPNGFDCSGFINYVYEHFGIDIPRTAKDISKIGQTISIKALMPADILVFGYVNKNGEYRVQHVGMVHQVGEGSYFSIIHSVSTGVNIDDPMSTSWEHWNKKLISIRRLPQVIHN